MTEVEKSRTVRLTTRDIEVLRFIGEQYAVRFDQIQRLLGRLSEPGTQTPGILSESATRVWLTRMKAIKVVEQILIYHKEPSFIWLTASGLQLVNLDFKHLVPKPSTFHHCYWCAQARLYLERIRPLYQWKSERYLRRDQAQTNAKHQNFDVPDALVINAEGQEIAIEIELTDKQQVRLNGLVRRRATKYHTTWYFCSKETQAIVNKARSLLEPKTQEHVIVYPLDMLKE